MTRDVGDAVRQRQIARLGRHGPDAARRGSICLVGLFALDGVRGAKPGLLDGPGYVVVQADVRGMHKSEGHAGVLTDEDAADYYELIEWAPHQPWSSGAVGLIGVSYLCMSEWRVAGLRPPALRAIVPWEGVTDLLRELAYQGGVPENGFLSTWWRFRMKRGRNRRFSMAEDFLQERDHHPFDDGFWADRRPNLAAIDLTSTSRRASV